MTDTTPDETKRLARRLTPSQRTLAVSVCLALLIVPVGLAVAQSTESPNVLWTSTDSAPVGDSHATADSDYVVATYGGGVDDTVVWHASNGSEAWRYDSGGGVYSSASGHAVVADSSDLYIASNPDAGELIERVSRSGQSTVWQKEFPDLIDEMDHDANRLYVVGGFSGVKAISKSDGSPVWNGSGPGARDVAVDEPSGSVYTARGDGSVISNDTATGGGNWVTELGADSAQFIDVGASGDVVYVTSDNPGDNQQDVFALDAGTGSIIWSVDTGTSMSGIVRRDVIASPDGETIYVGSYSSDEIRVMSAASGLTDTVWSANIPRHFSISPDGSRLYASIGADLTAIVAGGGNELTGTVTDQRNQAVEGATIIANGTDEDDSTTTDEDGTYSLTLLNGTYDVTAEKEGYISDNATVTVTIDTTQDFTLIEESAALSIQARHFMEHDESTPYSITYGEIDSSGNFVRSDVTNQTTATSNNSSVVTVNTITQELSATSNNKVNNRTHVTFNYTNSDGETFSREHNVTVANATVENLDILPPVTRFTATLGDKTMQTILIATGVAVVAAILAGAFSGIAAFTVIMCMGWVMRIVPDGTIIVVVLTAAFIGMNVAGNVDYTVRR